MPQRQRRKEEISRRVTEQEHAFFARIFPNEEDRQEFIASIDTEDGIEDDDDDDDDDDEGNGEKNTPFVSTSAP